MEIKPLIEKYRNLILVFLAPKIIRFICGTSKMERVNFEVVGETKKIFGNVIFAFWHGRQMALVYAHKDENVIIMTSYSIDGELQSGIMSSFGYEIVRGSHQKRGAIEGTIEIIRKMKEDGMDSSFAVDGPKGPAFEAKQGVVYIAQKTGRPIIPITSSAKSKKILSNWDKYLVPSPFNKLYVVYGSPVLVAPEDDLSKKSIELSAELNRITMEADKLAASAR